MKTLFTSATSANKRLWPVLVIFGALLLLMRIISMPGSAQSRSAPSSTQSTEERVLEDLIPKRVPIKIKIKGEKEKAFKNLKNEKWHSDFQLEVENVSDKDIYFLELWAVFPEIISENGHEVGIPLRYGRSEFIHYDTKILPQDLPIRPGASQIFNIPENYRKGWEAHKARENRPNPKRVQIKFVQLNFGDGTGFDGTDGRHSRIN